MSEVITSERLDDCPFCGSDVVTIESAQPPDQGYQVECAMCTARGPLSSTPAAAVEGWNDRQ